MDLREWVNSGLMTFFFLVVGLEAKRELDLGALRERRRVAIPVFASLVAMTFAVLIYLAFNAMAARRSAGARATADILAALWPERCAALVSVSGYLIGSQAGQPGRRCHRRPSWSVVVPVLLRHRARPGWLRASTGASSPS